MEQIVNRKYKPIFIQRPRYIILMGGRGAGRSYVASEFALAKLTGSEYFRAAIMRYILGDIKNSIYQEIIDRADENGVLENLKIAENNLTIKYGNNYIKGIGFKKSSLDLKAKLKSLASFNCVIIEEVDEVDEESFMQLDDSLRTVKSDVTIVLLLNPPAKNHWIIKRWFNLMPCDTDGFYQAELKDSYKENTLYIHTTYLDNIENINQSTIANYENYRKINPEHYFNMIRGLVSEGVRGRIFKNWKVISDKEYEELPFDPYNGLDFGFTNDPTALIEIKEHNNKIYLRELVYQTGLTNQLISDKMTDKGVKEDTETIADNSEPKSIEELRILGWNVLASVKGKDSVRVGVDMLLDKEVYYTESSVNIANEQQNYVWALDRNKEPTNKPVDKFNHAMDAVRGAVFTKSKTAFVGFA